MSEVQGSEGQHPPPRLLYTLSEFHRAVAEASALVSAGGLLGRLPRGDGHPVLVLPGFMATDQSTGLLRRHLSRLGYLPHPWGFGRNLGPRDDLVERMIERAARLAQDAGQALTLVGQSLGGIYAREIARVIPDQVRQVITLGSPFGALEAGGTNRGVARLFELSTGRTTEELRDEGPFSDLRAPPPVPSTAIFSRSDGIASWQVCIERDTPATDNVEIVGSHCGMAFNAMVIFVIADRLALPHGHWRRFQRHGFRRYLFPKPVFAPCGSR
ncbi:MAG: hypothetical protein V2I63_09200, partial [Pseudomonadales bacterium]|nr:hypothetical protein [Pseudomonadales bacterium]